MTRYILPALLLALACREAPKPSPGTEAPDVATPDFSITAVGPDSVRTDSTAETVVSTSTRLYFTRVVHDTLHDTVPVAAIVATKVDTLRYPDSLRLTRSRQTGWVVDSTWLVKLTPPPPADRGVPFGAFNLWKTYTTVKWGPAPLTLLIQGNDPGGIIQQIAAARAMHVKMFTFFTGGPHTATDLGCCLRVINGSARLDTVRFKAQVDRFNTPTIKAAIAAGVADGTILGNSLFDEPEVTGWGDGNTWGPDGWLTKPIVNRMAAYVRSQHPTLPQGVNMGGTGYRWRATERFTGLDFVIQTFLYWPTKGNLTAFRDSVETLARRDGYAMAYNINLLGGGAQDKDGVYDCAGPGQGGVYYAPNCRMTAAQVRDWGRQLGATSCALLMWWYDATFFARADNQQAFRDVATTLATAPRRSCRRP